jgi:hypothetical protein
MAIDEYMSELQGLAEQLDELSLELKEYAQRFDPVQLLSSIAFTTSLSRSSGPIPDDAGETFTYDAKVEYLAGVVLSCAPGSDDVGPVVAKHTLELIGQVFDAAFARMFLDSSAHEDSNEDTDQAVFLLKMERLYERMQGYADNIQEIDNEIFEPHRAFYVEQLGFCPSDTSILVRTLQKALNAELDRIASQLSIADDGTSRERETRANEELIALMDASSFWYPDVLNELTGIPISEIESLLDHLSVDFGCQPEFMTPLDDNTARNHPAIKLPDGGYLVPNPWTVTSCIHPWIEEFIRTSRNESFARRYAAHRSSASQKLTSKVLRTIFGNDIVHESQHYDGTEGHGEIDCLVSGELPIIAEVKSRSLTETGRRGHQPRVATVISKVITYSTDQTRRASEYLQGGGRKFATTEGGEQLQRIPEDIGDPIEIVVIRERMDPLTMQAFDLPRRDEQRKVWITSLSDFLMVGTILHDAASFTHYAATRSLINQRGIQVYVEADALGGYLENRLRSLLEFALDGDDAPDLVMLGESSSEINKYYTASEVGLNVEVPSSGVPGALSLALQESSLVLTRDWWNVVSDVMEYETRRWKIWTKYARQHALGQEFFITDRSAIRVNSVDRASIERRGDVAILEIPKSTI